MAYLMTLTHEEREVIMKMRGLRSSYLRFNDNGSEIPSVPSQQEKPKRKLSEEHKAKLHAAAAAARAKKIAEKAAEKAIAEASSAAAAPAPEPEPPAPGTEDDTAVSAILVASLAPAQTEPAAAPAKKKVARSQLPADASEEMKELWGKTMPQLAEIYRPLIGKIVGVRIPAGLNNKLALVTEILRLRAAGHTPENPAA